MIISYIYCHLHTCSCTTIDLGTAIHSSVGYYAVLFRHFQFLSMFIVPAISARNVVVNEDAGTAVIVLRLLTEIQRSLSLECNIGTDGM